MTRPRTVVIVGGGISGLATAFSLQEKATQAGVPLHCTLLESDPSWGGKIVTHRVNDIVTEAGPDSFLSQKPAGLDLCLKLGLADQLINTNETGKKASVLHRGRLHDLPEGLLSFVPKQLGPFLHSGLLSWSGLARMGLEFAVPPGSPRDDESLAAFLRRRFGVQAYERVLEPLMAGIYAGDAEQMSLRATFPRFFELEQQHGSIVRGMMAAKKSAASSTGFSQPRRTMFVSLKHGLSELVTALTTRLTQQGVQLRMGARVDALRVRSHELGRWMYDLILQDGSALSAESVVLATPAYVSADLLRPLTPIAGGLLDLIPYASTATIAMAFPRTQTSAIDGFGFIIPRTEQRHLIAATWTSLKWPHRAPAGQLLARGYVGGVGREDILHLSDDALLATVRQELVTLCGITAEPSYTEVNRWWKAMPQYTIGHLDRLVQLDAALSRYPGLVLTGAAYRGVGIPDCIRDGASAAEQVLQTLLGKGHHDHEGLATRQR